MAGSLDYTTRRNTKYKTALKVMVTWMSCDWLE